MATIKVKPHSAAIIFDIPAFVGTTGDTKGMFPEVGDHQPMFAFAPIKDDFGTLVFDHVDPARRNVLSPTFFQYWWEGEKLVVREDFNSGRYKKALNRSAISGFSYTETDGKLPRMYYTGRSDESVYIKTRVHLLNLLRFIEGKITDLQLRNCWIDPHSP